MKLVVFSSVSTIFLLACLRIQNFLANAENHEIPGDNTASLLLIGLGLALLFAVMILKNRRYL
jgi:hypothetical protein